MDNLLPIIHKEYKFEGLDDCLNSLPFRKCIFYASDFLKATEENLDMIETSVLHTMEIFKTLNIPTEEHFYLVFRSTPNDIVYKDWKVSELACAYMLVNGDPTDLKTIAVQQTALIDHMLQHIHPYLIVR